MSTHVSKTLPIEVQSAFDGEDLEHKLGAAYLVVTTDPDGAARPCMLSAGEILAVDDQTIRLAAWRGTHTAENLSRGSRVLICFVAENTVLYIKGLARALGSVTRAPVVRSEVKVDTVESDVHEGLPVAQGIMFSCEESYRSTLLNEWTRTLRALSQP